MRLAQELRRILAEEGSPFRAQLLREDLGRLDRLRELARSSGGIDAFREQGNRVGWTQGDARTAELAPALEPFLTALYEYETGQQQPDIEERLLDRWLELNHLRMERLVGCLSNPVPRPDS